MFKEISYVCLLLSVYSFDSKTTLIVVGEFGTGGEL